MNRICAVCRKQKNQLYPRQSKLVPDLPLLFCGDCLSNKREPRWAIILVARNGDKELAAEYVRDRRYVGDEILLKEIM